MGVTRHDHGIDHTRLENIIKIFNGKAQAIQSKYRDLEEQVSSEGFVKAIEHFGLKEDYDVIKKCEQETRAIDTQIEALRQQKNDLELQARDYKSKIRKYTQDENHQWGDYDTVRKGSQFYEFIMENNPDPSEQVKKLMESFYEAIWFTKDVEQATEIYNDHLKRLNEIK